MNAWNEREKVEGNATVEHSCRDKARYVLFLGLWGSDLDREVV